MSKEELKKYTISTIFPNEEIMNDVLNRKTADEMFKELGFKKFTEGKKINPDDSCVVGNEIIYYNGVYCISFSEDKVCKYNNNTLMFAEITMQELQAINEKCKELGWL